MWLLRFQMCAVVNRVAVPHLRLRHRHGNPECRVSSRSQTSQTCRRQNHASIHASAGAITIAVQFASKHGIAKTRCCSPPSASLPQTRNAAWRHNHRRAKSFAATSRIHTSAGAATIVVQLASKRDIAKVLQGQSGEFGATRVLLSNTWASDVTAATAGISNSASYVLSVSCLFLCGPLRRISVNARFYVQCCLVLWRGGCYGGPLQFPDEIQGQSNWKSSHCWLDSPVVYPDLVLVAVCGRDQYCLSVRFTCLLCVCTVLCSNCGESHRSHQNVRNDEVQVSLRKITLDMHVMDDNLES